MSDAGGPLFPYWFLDLGKVLAQCLQDVVTMRPVDPFEYMAHWLYRYADSEQYHFEKIMYLKKLRSMATQIKIDMQVRKRRVYDYKESIRKCKIALSKLGGPLGTKDLLKRYKKSAARLYYNPGEAVDDPSMFDEDKEADETIPRDPRAPIPPVVQDEEPAFLSELNDLLKTATEERYGSIPELSPAMKAALAKRKREEARKAFAARTGGAVEEPEFAHHAPLAPSYPAAIASIFNIPNIWQSAKKVPSASLDKTDKVFIDGRGKLRRAIDSKEVLVDNAVSTPSRYVALNDGTVIKTSNIRANRPPDDSDYPTLFKTPLGFIGRDPATGGVAMLDDQRFNPPSKSKKTKVMESTADYAKRSQPTSEWRYSNDAKVDLQELLNQFEAQRPREAPVPKDQSRDQLFDRYLHGGRQKLIAVDKQGRVVPKKAMAAAMAKASEDTLAHQYRAGGLHMSPSVEAVEMARVSRFSDAMEKIRGFEERLELEPVYQDSMEAIQAVAIEAMEALDPEGSASMTAMAPEEAVEALIAVTGLRADEAMEVVQAVKHMHPRDALETLKIIKVLPPETAQKVVDSVLKSKTSSAVISTLRRKKAAAGVDGVGSVPDGERGMVMLPFQPPPPPPGPGMPTGLKSPRGRGRGGRGRGMLGPAERPMGGSFSMAQDDDDFTSPMTDSMGRMGSKRRSLSSDYRTSSSRLMRSIYDETSRQRSQLASLKPVVAQWYLEDDAKFLSCEHPVLGRLGTSRVVDIPTDWFSREFSSRSFYDHELYTRENPDNDDLLLDEAIGSTDRLLSLTSSGSSGSSNSRSKSSDM